MQVHDFVFKLQGKEHCFCVYSLANEVTVLGKLDNSHINIKKAIFLVN